MAWRHRERIGELMVASIVIGAFFLVALVLLDGLLGDDVPPSQAQYSAVVEHETPR